MASKADTLKIAQADVETIAHKLASARKGRGLFLTPEQDVAEAVRLLEKSARNLRRTWGIEEED